MNRDELASIVNLVSAADGRNVTEQTYGAWFLLLGHISFDVAREATIEAMRDDTIKWVEPKHILGRCVKVLDRREADRRRVRALNAAEEKTVPVPKCVSHEISIVKCKDCTNAALVLANATDGINGSEYSRRFWGEICIPQ